jgi:hypothetical protein
MCEAQEAASAQTAQFLRLVNISTSCRAQKQADLEYLVHWGLHLLANIRCRAGCEHLVGASVVTQNPHFLYFSSGSPHLLDEGFGAIMEWPPVPAFFIVDSFAPT